MWDCYCWTETQVFQMGSQPSPKPNSANCIARIRRDWANRISRRLRAVGQPDCDEMAACVAGTALWNDGKKLMDSAGGIDPNFQVKRPLCRRALVAHSSGGASWFALCHHFSMPSCSLGFLYQTYEPLSNTKPEARNTNEITRFQVQRKPDRRSLNIAGGLLESLKVG